MVDQMSRVNLALLGRKVRVLRERRKMKKGELCKAAGLSNGYVGKIESEKKKPGVEAIYKLADALEVDPGFLFSNVDMTEEEIELEAKLVDAIKRRSGDPQFKSIDAILNDILSK